MKKSEKVACVVVCSILLVGISFAKTKYVPRANVRGTMKSFTEALGVKCDFCHVRDKPVNIKMTDSYDPKQDLDRMVHRRVAQAMIGMQEMFNKQAKTKTKTNCMACHQGSAHLPKEK